MQTDNAIYGADGGQLFEPARAEDKLPSSKLALGIAILCLPSLLSFAWLAWFVAFPMAGRDSGQSRWATLTRRSAQMSFLCGFCVAALVLVLPSLTNASAPTGDLVLSAIGIGGLASLTTLLVWEIRWLTGRMYPILAASILVAASIQGAIVFINYGIPVSALLLQIPPVLLLFAARKHSATGQP